MSKVTIDEYGEFEVDPHVAGLLQAVSEERDELRARLEELEGAIEKWKAEECDWKDEEARLLARVEGLERHIRAADKVMKAIDDTVQLGKMRTRTRITDARELYSEPLTYRAALDGEGER